MIFLDFLKLKKNIYIINNNGNFIHHLMKKKLSSNICIVVKYTYIVIINMTIYKFSLFKFPFKIFSQLFKTSF